MPSCGRGRLDMSPATLEERLLDLNRRDVLGLSAWRFAWQLERVAGREPDWAAIAEPLPTSGLTWSVKHLSQTGPRVRPPTAR